jgi:undecaprenyl-diphosphatase
MGKGTAVEMKGVILQDDHIHLFIIGNIVAFVVALLAVKTFISVLTKYSNFGVGTALLLVSHY